MGKALAERFIQQAVARELNRRYYRRQPAYVSTEVYTELRRADVLLAFMRAPGRPYVVVVEAKSRGTIRQLNLNRSERGGKLNWLPWVLAAGALLFYWQGGDPQLSLVAGVGAWLLRALLLRSVPGVPALRQLGRYPANESWLAIGADTFARPDGRALLAKHCRRNGVGLLVVDADGRIEWPVVPRPRHTFNDYLSRYGRREEILASIDHQPRYGPTPPERRQNARRIGAILLLVALVAAITLWSWPGDGPEDTGSDPDPTPYATPDSVRIGSAPSGAPEALDPAVMAPAPRAPDCPATTRNAPLFYVVDTLLPPAEIPLRQARLRAAGMRGHTPLPAECLGLDPALEVLTTGTPYPDHASGAAALARYRALMASLGLPADAAFLGVIAYKR